MSVISKASRLLGVYKSIKNKIGIFDLERVYALLSRIVSAIEETSQRMEGLTGTQKRETAIQMAMERIKAPFGVRWLVRLFLSRFIDKVIAYKNEVYGKLWGTGDPSTGYQEDEEPLPVPAEIQPAQSAKKASIVLDGVTTESVLGAIRQHNESKSNLHVNVFCLVQFILETGVFKHFRGYNLGGIKATEGWIRTGGKVWNAQTKEAVDGKLVGTTAAFRAYDNVLHFLDDYAGIIHRVYPLAAQNNDCMWLYLGGLCKNKYGSGYATDPQYFSKLCTLAVRHAPTILGDSWQEHLVRMFELARQRGFSCAGQEQDVLNVLR